MKLGITEYNRVHKWVEGHLIKQGECFYCGKRGYTHYSNIDHQYSEDRSEWQEVCPKCHVAYDKEMGLIDYSNRGGSGRPPSNPKTLRALARLKSYAWYVN